MENSKIEWTNHTANLWHGCQKVHEGAHWGPKAPRLAIKKTFFDLIKFQRDAHAKGEIHRVFVGSMMDIFENPMPLVDGKGNSIPLDDPESQMFTHDMRETLFHNISRGLYPNLQFLLLTKRPTNINKYIPVSWRENWAPKNVMFGISVVNQQTANTMIPELLKVKGRRFLSCEPLLGPINITQSHIDYSVPTRYIGNTGIEWTDPGRDFIGLDWVIVGGESGHGARPMHPDWVMNLKRQCDTAAVPFFFKQWGEWAPVGFYGESKNKIWLTTHTESFGSFTTQRATQPSMFEMFGDNGNTKAMVRIGKKEAGSLLNNREYKAFPPHV